MGDDATLLLVFLEHDFGSSKSGVVGPNSIGECQFRKNDLFYKYSTSYQKDILYIVVR